MSEKKLLTGVGMRLYPEFNPKTTALIIIDIQNDECHPNGHYSKSGIDVGTEDDDRPSMSRPVRYLKKLIPVCREAKVPIIWTRHQFREPKIDCGIICKVRPFLDKGGFRAGPHPDGPPSWGAQIDDRILDYVKWEEDWFLDKVRISSFYNTPLEVWLRSLNIETLIVTGCVTWNCVETCCRDAQQRDYQVILPHECTGGHTHFDLQEPTLKVIQQAYGDVLSTDVVIKELKEFAKKYGTL